MRYMAIALLALLLTACEFSYTVKRIPQFEWGDDMCQQFYDMGAGKCIINLDGYGRIDEVRVHFYNH